MTRYVAQCMVAELRRIQFVPAAPFLSDMMVITFSECLEMPHQSKPIFAILKDTYPRTGN